MKISLIVLVVFNVCTCKPLCPWIKIYLSRLYSWILLLWNCHIWYDLNELHFIWVSLCEISAKQNMWCLWSEMICNASYLFLKYRSPFILFEGFDFEWALLIYAYFKSTQADPCCPFSKISFVWVSQQSLHVSLLVNFTERISFSVARHCPGISSAFLLLKMYQLSCCLTDHIVRVNHLLS